MVQREVADRLFAQPRTKAYGAVCVLVQLVAERTGFHPVSRTVFRPPPNVDSALVAFRRVGLPDDFARVKRVVDGLVRASAQDAAELARAARRRDARAAAAALAAIGLDADDAGGGARRRPISSRSPRARVRASAPREDQPRPRRRPAARRRQARTLTVYQRIGLADRIDVDAGRRAAVDGFPEDTLVRGALEPLAAPPPSSRAGSDASRSGSRSPPASAAAAPTPPRRCASRTRRSRAAAAQLHAVAARVGADVPFFLRGGRSSARATAPSSSRSTCRRTTGCSCSSRTTREESTASVYGAFDARDGADGWEERRDAFRHARERPPPARPRAAAAERPRALAAHRRAARPRRVPCRRQRRRPDGVRALPPPAPTPTARASGCAVSAPRG